MRSMAEGEGSDPCELVSRWRRSKRKTPSTGLRPVPLPRFAGPLWGRGWGGGSHGRRNVAPLPADAIEIGMA